MFRQSGEEALLHKVGRVSPAARFFAFVQFGMAGKAVKCARKGLLPSCYRLVGAGGVAGCSKWKGKAAIPRCSGTAAPMASSGLLGVRRRVFVRLSYFHHQDLASGVEGAAGGGFGFFHGLVGQEVGEVGDESRGG